MGLKTAEELAVKKFVAVEHIDSRDRFVFTRTDEHPRKDPTKYSDGTIGFRVLLESNDRDECVNAVEDAFETEGMPPVEAYLRLIHEKRRHSWGDTIVKGWEG